MAAAVWLCLVFALCFQHSFCHFLNEQRNAIGPLDNVLLDVCREQFVADDAVDHRFDFTPRQPIDRERGHMRLSDPGRLEFWPERYDQQHAKSPNPVHSPPEHFQARRVGPMRILENLQHRALARQRFQLRSERFQRFLPALLRG